MTSPAFLTTPRLYLRSLIPEDATLDYLAWLNDQDVLRYRGPKAFPTTMTQLRAYLSSIPERHDVALAVCLKETGRHIGNITLNTILWGHRSAELSIMLGAKDIWRQGYATEAITALTYHAMMTMGLHRLWAESPNPAFNHIMQTLHWEHEGTKREAFFLDGHFTGIECWAKLKR